MKKLTFTPVDRAQAFFALAIVEHDGATKKHAPIASLHEGYAILLEEVDELWDEVRKKDHQRDPREILSELKQIARRRPPRDRRRDAAGREANAGEKRRCVMSEQLFTCPCCHTPGFTASGLHKHQCRAKPDRARLSLVEIAAAKPVHVTHPGEPVRTKEKGGAA